jgi:hypothetical protein
MGLLNEQQKQRAIEVMQEYLAAPENLQTGPSTEIKRRGYPLDQERIRVIANELKPLLVPYLSGGLNFKEFKSKIDSVNKRNRYWGFKGVKGQMFFNLIVKVAEDLDECDEQIKTAITLPENDTMAVSRIKTFDSYIKRISQEWVDAGNDSRGCPKPSSIPFFLSYFWQVQDYTVWPVYYTNSVQTMKDLNLWEESGNLGDDYIAFKDLHHELADLFSKESGELFNLYTVEHVFWFKGSNPLQTTKPANEPAVQVKDGKDICEPFSGETKVAYTLLPESYVPPIIAILPRIARHEEELIEAAKRSGTTLERAFEKYVDAAFTILGYETKLLGQGKGRVPDGLAIANDERYAIIWDSKIRNNGYSLGTDDRTIREYIHTQSRELKRRSSMRNIYYMIISSAFSDDYDDAIRSIKMETDVNEVCLVEVEALVEMVDAKLRSPLQITLGSDGLQQLFATSGILTAENVKEFLI